MKHFHMRWGGREQQPDTRKELAIGHEQCVQHWELQGCPSSPSLDQRMLAGLWASPHWRFCLRMIVAPASLYGSKRTSSHQKHVAACTPGNTSKHTEFQRLLAPDGCSDGCWAGWMFGYALLGVLDVEYTQEGQHW